MVRPRALRINLPASPRAVHVLADRFGLEKLEYFNHLCTTEHTEAYALNKTLGNANLELK